MTNNLIFENTKHERLINTISHEFFPEKYPVHWHKYVEIVTYPINKTSADDAISADEISTTDIISDNKASAGKAISAGEPDTSSENPLPVIVSVSQKEYTLFPGDTVFVWPGELHSTLSNPGRQIIGIQFPIHLLFQLKELNILIPAFKKYHHLNLKENYDIAIQVHDATLHMVDLYNKSTQFYGVETLITLYELFIALGKFTYSQNNLPFTQVSIDNIKKIQEACEYITDNCVEDISLATVSELIGFSPSYFSRIFKSITGYSFVEYNSIQRVKNAENLLADSKYTITEVSYMSGFKSISTFNRTFLSIKGCSPRDYRKYYLGEAH